MASADTSSVNKQTMPPMLTDAGVVGALVVLLLFVVVLDKLLGTPEAIVPTQGQPNVITIPARTRQLRLLVTESHRDANGIWDDMPKLLRDLGEGYKFTEVRPDKLYDPKALDDCDVLFFTCGRGNTDPAFTENLRNFVAKGGTIYASDWRYDCIAKAFPDMVSKKAEGEGRGGILDARVADPGLRDVLGSDKIQLNFNLSKWKTAAFEGPRVKILLDGDYEIEGPKDTKAEKAHAPFLVKFNFNKGTVIFTSFHNEAQNSAVEKKLLKYLVFSAINAQLENQVNESLVKGGFSPQKQNLLSASRDDPTVTYTYRATKAGKMRFILGFNDPNERAKLKLSVTGPDGGKVEKEGTSTIVIEQNSSGQGDWRYTVTALAVPFENFPFSVTVAESD